ncbi:hypothetical protein PCANC_25131 [Puccinia coronata f. sp. avenae]|uniref:Uncharacterized protein n=1 Tax=Puccinia coronata f. sp. avenae TaxID=200324 RepID=A0A2N5U0N4_9BASI|nr:hypothetical protein PCANC_25131 [Puccinia coronata f. sp. avenae]
MLEPQLPPTSQGNLASYLVIPTTSPIWTFKSNDDIRDVLTPLGVPFIALHLLTPAQTVLFVKPNSAYDISGTIVLQGHARNGTFFYESRNAFITHWRGTALEESQVTVIGVGTINDIAGKYVAIPLYQKCLVITVSHKHQDGTTVCVDYIICPNHTVLPCNSRLLIGTRAFFKCYLSSALPQDNGAFEVMTYSS